MAERVAVQRSVLLTCPVVPGRGQAVVKLPQDLGASGDLGGTTANHAAAGLGAWMHLTIYMEDPQQGRSR